MGDTRKREWCHVHSPAITSSTMDLLPEVMYLVETPRATKGWERRALSSA